MDCWVGRPLDQRAAAQADAVTGVPGHPAIDFRAAALFVLRQCGVTFKARAATTKSFASSYRRPQWCAGNGLPACRRASDPPKRSNHRM